MPIWNVSDDLKNGVKGVFKGVKGDKLEVYFEKTGTVEIKGETWIQRNRQGKIIESVVQFPIDLAYAATCHKSQGLEVSAVVLHCSKEFVPGMVYVAVSRVKSADALRVIGFNAHQILPADPEVIEQCSRTLGEIDPSLRCCRKRPVLEDCFEIQERFEPNESDESEDCIYHFPIEMSDGMVQAYFERDDTDLAVTVGQLYDQMQRHESELSRPPLGWLDERAILSTF